MISELNRLPTVLWNWFWFTALSLILQSRETLPSLHFPVFPGLPSICLRCISSKSELGFRFFEREGAKMSVWNYVVTAHKPTNVTHSCVGNFTAPNQLNLIIAYVLQIKLFSFTNLRLGFVDLDNTVPSGC